MNLLPSVEYTTKWPFSAIDVLFVLNSGEASLLIHEILFLPKAAIFCHFLAISREGSPTSDPVTSKDRTYSRNTASQGREIGPSPENPNSSSDSLRSSWNILALRNAKGTVNLLPSDKKADAEAMVKCSKWTCGEGAREDTAVAGTWHMVDDLYQHIFFLLLEESFWYTERGKAAVIHQPYRDRNDGKMVEVFLRGLM
ncbi:hypothetical protein MUK42_10918 [Musa troglodytarum]|uniref:Uncharacterized protein n=1 Tax=Musa troglodytarum TaxID=320322 RepID=A0A9E7GFW6_9LILI|nr:hypothetical protein MUK42_10918 [Musa troglodytarum]